MIKLLHGKFEKASIRKIGKIDLIVADPPDNIGIKYDGFNDKQPPEVYEQNIRDWLGMMADLTRGPIFFTFNEKWTELVEHAIEGICIPIIQRLQWYYTFGQDQTSRGRYGLCYRPVYWMNSDYVRTEEIKVPSARQTKYKDKRAAPGGKMPPNVWEFSRICGTFGEKRKWSPNQLPEAMIERIVKGHCCPGGRVLDPFLGSGTTAIVCKRLDVNCVGVEISENVIQQTADHLGETYDRV